MPQTLTIPALALTETQLASKVLPTTRQALRRPLFVAVHRSQGLPLDERDIRLLGLVWEYRLLSARQIGTLMAEWQWESLRHRLTELFHCGYLDRPRHQLYLKLTREEPWDMVYAPSPKGLKALSIETHTRFDTKNSHLSPYFMAHRLAINAVRIALEGGLAQPCLMAGRRPTLELAFWLWDRQWHETVNLTTQRGQRPTQLFPDAFCSLIDLARQLKMFLFLEIDRGSEDLGRLIAKLRLYSLLVQQKRLVAPLFPQDQIKGFRVLIIVKNAARQRNLLTKATIQELPKAGMFYTTTKDQLTAEQILTAPIWTTLKGEAKAIHAYPSFADSAFVATSAKEAASAGRRQAGVDI